MFKTSCNNNISYLGHKAKNELALYGSVFPERQRGYSLSATFVMTPANFASETKLLFELLKINIRIFRPPTARLVKLDSILNCHIPCRC